MKIIEKEKSSVSLTYMPFENIKELLKQQPEKEKKKGDKKNG